MERLPSTRSEVLFADYLGQAGQEWSFAPIIGRHRPDFLVNSRVVCEVSAIEADHLPEQVGSRDAPHPVRQKIRDKWSQAEAARKAGYPFVLVLHQDGWCVDLSLHVVTSALFGDVSIAMAFDPASGTMTDEDGFVFGGRGMTEPTGNRNLSALAHLRSFNPTLVDLEAAWKEVGPLANAEEGIRLYVEIEERLTRRGVFDPDASCLRLQLVHNRQAQHALPTGWLGGDYDEEWGLEPSTGQLECLHAGSLHHRVPGGSARRSRYGSPASEGDRGGSRET